MFFRGQFHCAPARHCHRPWPWPSSSDTPSTARAGVAKQRIAHQTAAAKKRLEEINAAYAEPGADLDKLAEEQAKLEAMINTGGADELEVAADALRLPPWDTKVDVLSGGEKRRVALCKLLLAKPDLLLLDEPTNHLDAESVEWLEQYLQRFPGTVVAVTHDRYFLDNAAGWILELDRGYPLPGARHSPTRLATQKKPLPIH